MPRLTSIHSTWASESPSRSAHSPSEGGGPRLAAFVLLAAIALPLSWPVTGHAQDGVFLDDPLQQKLLAADGAAGDDFGLSVALSGDRAIVGASQDDDNGRDSGSAYVFERTAGGGWREVAKLVAADGAAGNQFGTSVALSGDRAIVGAPGDVDNGFDSGSAYVFERAAGGKWNEVAKLVAADGAAGDLFGVSVALSGDRAIVGAPFDDNNGNRSGSAYVFGRAADGGWREVAKLVAADGAVNHGFGGSIALSGDRAIVGAAGDDDNGPQSGSAYVFERATGGGWSEVAKLTAADGAAYDSLGRSVALSGDRAIAGANWDDDNGSVSGSAYVFERAAGGGWSEVAKLIAADGAARDEFGQSVAISDDRAIVGANWDEDNGSGSGSAYVFGRDAGGGWSEVAKLVAADGARNDQFGYSVALSGNQAIVGSLNSGSAYVFDFAAPVCNGLAVTVDLNRGDTPTSGDDVILGTPAGDTINAMGGNDTVCGMGGADVIYAGGGNDWIEGGPGDDLIYAGGGNDWVEGGPGDDLIRGGAGDDELRGQTGDDTIEGYGGADRILGGAGVDEIDGGAGNDTLFLGPGATVGSGFSVKGGGGDDIVYGGPDADDIRGNEGDDRLFGRGGDDEINGGSGDDVLDGGAGDDVLDGGSGDDVVPGVAGSVVAWGDERSGGPGYIPNPPPGTDFVAAALGNRHGTALRADGSLVSWGDRSMVRDTPSGTDFVAVAAGTFNSLALKADGSLVSWGGDYTDFTGQVSNTPTGSDFVAISSNGYHSLALKADGSLVNWGGTNPSVFDNTPTAINFEAIAAGTSHGLAMKANGSLVSWGDRFFVRATPSGTDFVAIASGSGHGLALKGDGSLVSWGGDPNRPVVTDTPSGTDFVAIAAGSVHSLALRADGSLVSWGYDYSGQVTDTPPGNDFVAIAAGGQQSLAIRAVARDTDDALCNGLPVTVDLNRGDTPTSGDDVILGTPAGDTINALGGNDTICAEGGADVIYAGSGDDWVEGGPGDDLIRGGAGNDELRGQAGNDTVMGNPGADRILGGAGVDEIDGGTGDDILLPGPGATAGSGFSVRGGGGDDVVYGGPDADDIRGNAGDDRLYGRGGDDEINGGPDEDWIAGDSGDDVLNGGMGDDVVRGGAGDDMVRGDLGDDAVLGGEGRDSVEGGGGDDVLVGGGSPGDVCRGQAGVDVATSSCERTFGVP